MKPKKTKELEWQQIGDIYILTDKETNKTYTLDAISFLVWLQCDGNTDIETIVDVFSVNGNRDIVKSAIMNILKNLQELKLIEIKD
ncbi:MAG: PqqD family protein [Candidatus Aenigmatarchaeota archaeon]